MIKPLATLIALGTFATTAAAQTSVTLYGQVDLSVQHLRSGDRSPMAGKNMTRLADGTTYGPGSRWGIRVSEDLADGLKAGVVIESGFNADTGLLGQGGRGFGRQSYISLSSASAGELRLGRQYMLHDEVLPVTSPVGGVTAMNPGGVYTLSSGTIQPFIDGPRIDNAVQYLSPIMNGFRLQAMIALGEGVQDLYKGLKASYTNGPFNTAASYEESKARVAPAGGDSTANKVLEIGANYDFDIVRLFGGYQQGKNLTTGAGTQMGTLTMPGLAGAATDLKAYNVGASKQVGAANLVANYTRSRFSNASGADATIGRLGFGATYALSKQTSIYGVVAVAAGDLKNSVNEKQVYQLGLRKLF
jgi:predicted porin